MSHNRRIAILVALVVSVLGFGASNALAAVHHDRNRHHDPHAAASTVHHRKSRHAGSLGHARHHGVFVLPHRHHRGGQTARRHGRHHHAVVSKHHHRRGHIIAKGRHHRLTHHAALQRRTQLCQQVLVHGSWVSRCR